MKAPRAEAAIRATRPDDLRPTTAYRVQLPPREGSYRHGLHQVIDPGETDRFLISPVAPHDGGGTRTYAVTLELDCGTIATGPVLSTSASVRVRV